MKSDGSAEISSGRATGRRLKAPKSPPRASQKLRKSLSVAPLPTTVAPQKLDAASAAALAAVARAAQSPNSVRAYQGAARYWEAWHRARHPGQAMPFPVPVEVVLMFLADHLLAPIAGEEGALAHRLPADVDRALVASRIKAKLGPLSLATVEQRLAVLSKTHRSARVSNPCQDVLVQEALVNFRKVYAVRDITPRKQAPLTREPLLAMLASCDDSLRGLRDRALLLFAFASGGRRRSEVTGAVFEKLQQLEDGSFTYELRYSKTNQTGAARSGMFKPIAGPAAAAMQAWLVASGIRSGPLFRRIRKSVHVAEPLTPSAVRDIVRKRAALAGLEGAFSAHSLRSGFVTEAGTQNASLADTMAMTGHTDVATVLGYYHSQAGTRSHVANLLGTDAADRAR